MAVGREHQHNNFGVMNFVYQTMLFGNTPTPLYRSITRKLLRFTSTRTRCSSAISFSAFCIALTNPTRPLAQI